MGDERVSVMMEDWILCAWCWVSEFGSSRCAPGFKILEFRVLLRS